MIDRDRTPHINQTTFSILALYRSNYLRSFHTRDICRSIGMDTKPVRMQLKRLEEASILKSTLKGKNIEYRLNMQNYLTKYYINLAEEYTTLAFLDKHFLIKRVLEELTGLELLTENADSLLPGIVLLFGSFASELADDKSDIDILTISLLHEKGSRNVSPHLAGDHENTTLAFKRLSTESAVLSIQTVVGREINVKSMTPRQFASGLRHGSPFEREILAHHIALKNIDDFCDLMWRFFRIWQ